MHVQWRIPPYKPCLSGNVTTRVTVCQSGKRLLISVIHNIIYINSRFTWKMAIKMERERERERERESAELVERFQIGVVSRLSWSQCLLPQVPSMLPVEHSDQQQYVCCENSLAQNNCSFGILAQTLICCWCKRKMPHCHWHIKFVNTLKLGGWLTTDGKFGLFEVVWP